jgi:(R,R)-butanediol dehydrogenase / meso-butanediol dehydrogenase / diacetyl reductase
MRAAFIPSAEHLDVADATLRDRAGDEAVIAVAACGICGSNLHEWRHPDQGITSEILPGAGGHELSGRVLVAADDGSGPAVGERVTVEPNRVRGCGACTACRSGSAWFCPAPRVVGGWGFAERMVVPTAALFAVPDVVSDEAATLTEPLACGVHALRSSHLAATAGIDGARVAVIGAGVAGLLTVAAARHLGAAAVAAVARHPHQAAAAAAVGADDVIAARDDDVADQLKRVGADLVVEAVGGSGETIDLAMRGVVAQGEVAVLGLFDTSPVLNTRRASFRELRLSFPLTYGVRDGVHDFEIALDILAAADFDHLITHRFPLAEVGAAFAFAADKSVGALRVVVTP